MCSPLLSTENIIITCQQYECLYKAGCRCSVTVMIRGHLATEVNSRPVSLCYCSHELWLSQEVLTFISKGFIKCDGVKLKVSDKVGKKKEVILKKNSSLWVITMSVFHSSFPLFWRYSIYQTMNGLNNHQINR